MNTNRREEARQVRISAANMAFNRPHPRHVANDDEQKFRKDVNGRNMPCYLASFTKGMAHDYQTGLIKNPDDFKWFILGTDSGDPRDFMATPLGPKGGWFSTKAKNTKVNVRGWESQGAGLAFDLEGPDSWAVTMPPAPDVGSHELTAEMAEVYAQALLRDVPFGDIVDGTGEVTCAPFVDKNTGKSSLNVGDIVAALQQLKWFKPIDCCGLTQAEISRRRGPLTSKNVFRGITVGDDIGPYISQFLLVGNEGINSKDKITRKSNGTISYGSIRIDQRVRVAKSYDDHMTSWDEWYDAQNGADFRNQESYVDNDYRFITTPRDLA
ncbi:MAG: bromoperoxidase, partial [Chloroflexota bacterium]